MAPLLGVLVAESLFAESLITGSVAPLLGALFATVLLVAGAAGAPCVSVVAGTCFLFVFAIFSGWLVGVVSGVGTAFGTVAVGTTWVWHLELLKLFVELFELLLPFAVVVCTFGTVAV